VIKQSDDRLLLQGPVTIVTVTALLTQLRAQLAPGIAVLDFEGVTEVDSAAVALALECLREARRRQLSVSLANLPESMRNLAELYSVSELLQAGSA